MSWSTIESDPGVFTELIRSFGVRGVQVEEIYDFDSANLAELAPVYGLIFLFKWEREEKFDDADGRQLLDGEHGNSVFFARQQVNNACATQAIISVILNHPELDIGAEMRSFLEFTSVLPPDMRGDAIGNSDFIRLAHNEFARPEPFVFDPSKDESTEDEDAFHFISYVPVNGVLYELDGLKPGPITLGPVSDTDPHDWLAKAINSIQRRIAKYQREASSEIRFNLLALVRDREEVYRERLSELGQRRQEMSDALSDDNDVSAAVSMLDEQLESLQRHSRDEAAKRAQWKLENERRKHNYVPFVFRLLNVLAEKGKLGELAEQGAKVTAERRERAKAAKQKAEQSKKSVDSTAVAGGSTTSQRY